MKLHLNQLGEAHRIRRHGPGEIVVNETAYTASIIVAPQRIITDWPPRRITEVTAETLSAVDELDPELVLLGTGMRLRFPVAGTTRTLHARGIGVEVMDTGAACRTYNILAAEGRRVVAALVVESPAG